MKSKILLSLITMCLCCQKSSAQQKSLVPLSKIIPPSPEVAQIAKYGNFPVSFSTGTINIDIPVYTITTKQFQWPLSLSYHASGVKVDEVSSNVGLGWILANAQGVISRSIVGQPDEAGLLMNSVPLTTAGYYALTSQQKYQLALGITGGNQDPSPDQFSFNFNGMSGTFQLHRTKGTMLQSEANVQISMLGLGNSFQAIDDRGNVYSFTAYESSSSRNFIQSHSEEGEIMLGSNEEVHDGITAWYLTKILSQDRSDSIQFIYSSDIYNVLQYQDNFSFMIGNAPSSIEGNCTPVRISPEIKKINTQNTTTTSPILTEIRYPSGKLVLNYLFDREDMGKSVNKIGNLGRLNSIDVYSRVNTVYEHLKKIQLYQSYFVSTKPATKDSCYAYRLRLDSVNVFDKNGVALSRAQRFEYNSTPLPFRTSYAQDYWGYYNGANNQEFTPSRVISWTDNGGTTTYTIGSANRQPNPTYMKAGMLEKMHYPTGGYAVFDFEPHRCWDPQLLTNPDPGPQWEWVREKVTATPPQPTNIAIKNFSHTGPDENVTVGAFFKAFYGKSDNPPYVKISRIISGTPMPLLTITSSDANNDKWEYRSLALVNGFSYRIEAYVHAGSYPPNEVWAEGWLDHRKPAQSQNPPPVAGGYRTVGGLRIKTIANYSATDELLTKEEYSYPVDGTMIAHPQLFNREYLEVYNKKINNGSFCSECVPFKYRVYNNQSPYTIGNLNGALIGYSYVSKSKVDGSGKKLGAETFSYNILTDDFGVFPGTDNYYPLSKDWQNGKLMTEEVFSTDNNGNLMSVKAKEYLYQDYKKDTFNYLILSKIHANDCQDDETNYSVYQGRKYYGRKFPVSEIITQTFRAATGEVLIMKDTIEYVYTSASKHNNPIQITNRSSEGMLLHHYLYYPEDMITLLGDNGGGVYPSMIQKGMTGPLIYEKKYNGATLLSQHKTNYATLYNSFIKPIQMVYQKGSEPLVTTKDMVYDGAGNLVQESTNGGAVSAYLYDYDKIFPVMSAVNADSSAVAYTSFEADGKGRWIFSGGISDDPTAVSGGRSFNIANAGTNGLQRPGLVSAQTYQVSYWTKNTSAYSITGTITGYPRQGKSIGGWTYFEHLVTGQTTIKISGSGFIDEVRLCPKDALMTTYTYTLGVGQTGQFDATSRQHYFEYDSFGRLKAVLDQNKNALKAYQYKYAGQ